MMWPAGWSAGATQRGEVPRLRGVPPSTPVWSAASRVAQPAPTRPAAPAAVEVVVEAPTASCSASRVDYVVLCAAGLEDLAAAEVARRCGVSRDRVRLGAAPPASDRWDASSPEGLWPGGAGVGKVIVSLPAVATAADGEARRKALASIPCAAGLLALVCEAVGVETSFHGLDAIHAAVRGSTTWGGAVAAWRSHRRFPPGKAIPFRASGVRDGRHEWTSNDLAKCVGDACPPRVGDAPLRVDLDAYALEVVALSLQSVCLVGLNLWPAESTFRRSAVGAEPRPILPFAGATSRLRLSTAYLLLELAGVREGDVVLDPMCGVGTIPILAARRFKKTVALGGDVNDASVAKARASALAVASSSRGEADDAPWHAEERTYDGGGGPAADCGLVWSSDRLPLRSASVDRVVVDLPFGKTHQVRGKGGRVNARKRLLDATLDQCARVTRRGGSLVALASSRKALDASASSDHWTVVAKRPINCGGSIHWVGEYERNGTPWTAPRTHVDGPKKQRPRRSRAPEAPVGKEAAPPARSWRLPAAALGALAAVVLFRRFRRP